MKHLLSIQSLLSTFLLAITLSVSPLLLADELEGQDDQQSVSEQIVEQSININQASAEQIASILKGVGLKKAQAIVEWRKLNGEFTHLEQLLEVKGIGEKTVEANRLKIQF